MATHAQLSIYPFSSAEKRGLVTDLMAVTHFLQKRIRDDLMAGGRYQTLKLSYAGYTSLLVQCDLSPGELAARLGVSKQACSAALKEMEQLGFITRRTHSRDTRSRVISLTTNGNELLADAAEVMRAVDKQLREELGDARIRRTTRLLVGLARSLGIDEGESYHDSDDNSLAILHFLLSRLTGYFSQWMGAELVGKGFDDMNASHGQLLALVFAGQGRIKFISLVMGISKQAVAVGLKKLETLGYVVRQTDPTDNRQFIFQASLKGQTLMRAALESVRALEKQLKTLLPGKDYLFLENTFNEMCDRTTADLDKLKKSTADIYELAAQLLDELDVASARTLGQLLLTMTKGEH